MRLWRASVDLDGPDRLRDLRGELGGMAPAAEAFAARLALGRVRTADLPLRGADPAVADRMARTLRDGLDAVVAGEPPGLDASLAPSHKATVLIDAGLAVVAGVNCRDRNRVALEGELAALAHAGVSAVLAVTGDHPATTVRPDARPVFDLDSTQLVELAHRAAHLVAVGEQPIAPPVGVRVERLLTKIAAGAQVCYLNLCGGIDVIERFVTEARDRGARVPFLVSVPLIASAESASRLSRLPGLALPDGLVEAITHASDPVTEGIARAVSFAQEVMEIEGVAGVHLGAVAVASDTTGERAAELIARAGARIGGGEG